MYINTETIPGMTIVQSLGLATGSTVRAKHIGKDIFAGFKNIIGGELKAYTELLTEARNEALNRMLADAAAGCKWRSKCKICNFICSRWSSRIICLWDSSSSSIRVI